MLKHHISLRNNQLFIYFQSTVYLPINLYQTSIHRFILECSYTRHVFSWGGVAAVNYYNVCSCCAATEVLSSPITPLVRIFTQRCVEPRPTYRTVDALWATRDIVSAKQRILSAKHGIVSAMLRIVSTRRSFVSGKRGIVSAIQQGTMLLYIL